MAKKNRVISHLVCVDCKERNYTQVVTKTRSLGSLQIGKYCRRCRKHKLHKEAK